MLLAHAQTPDQLHEAAHHFVLTLSDGSTTRTARQVLETSPVWLPPPALTVVSAHPAVATTWSTDHARHVLLLDQAVAHYSPLLQPTGLATCLLAACWLLAGWWHRAFHFGNTLACQPERTLAVTAQTWITTSLLLASLVALSHHHWMGPAAVNNNDYYYYSSSSSSSVWERFTKSDVIYIADSLTVLAVWRFLASHILGYWKPDDDDEE